MPIPVQTNNNQNLVCWYPASGGDLHPLVQGIFLPIGKKMQAVKKFLYVDNLYKFEKNGDSGLYSVVYGHNEILSQGRLERYLGFKCLRHITDNNVCIFINADIRTFEMHLIKNNVKIDLVCFLPYGVANGERPQRLAELKVPFLLGFNPQEENQDFRLEEIVPNICFSMCGGGPHSVSLKKVVPI